MLNIGRLAIIGSGAMGTAFAGGVISAGIFSPENVVMADIDDAKLQGVASNLHVATTSDNSAAAREASVVLIAVKPPIVRSVIRDISEVLTGHQLVISIAAGVKLDTIESELPTGTAVIRAMPNTPCLIGAGAIGFSRGKSATDEHVATAKRIFDAVGISFEVSESLLNAVTGLSGSGPAYIYMLIEALSDGGVLVGLPREIATQLASQTVMGAARMVIDLKEHPARLKDQVASPGGTTMAGIDALERAGFRSAIIEAIKAATQRAEELG